MAWTTLQSNQWISFQDIIDSGIPLIAGQSHYTGSAKWLTKAELTARYQVISRLLESLASNQWVTRNRVASSLAETQYDFKDNIYGKLIVVDPKVSYVTGFTTATGSGSACVSTKTLYSPCYYDGTIAVNQYIYTPDQYMKPYTHPSGETYYWINGKAVRFDDSDFVEGFPPYISSTSLYRYKIYSVNDCGGGGGTPTVYSAEKYIGCSYISTVVVQGYGLTTNNFYLGDDYNVYKIISTTTGTPVATCSGNGYGSCASVPIP